MRAPDLIFSDDELALVYDQFEGERDDLDAYEAIVDEFAAQRVLDVGCGTGEFALRLVASGRHVTGLDPAVASIRVAKSKPGAEHVRWIEGDVTALDSADPPVEVDLVTMTANVAQVFVEDDDWMAVLHAAAAALIDGGLLVFETRDPAKRAWEGWTPEASFQRGTAPDGAVIETWNEVRSVAGPLVTFDGTFRFADGSTKVSTSVLRFRTREEIEASLADAGFTVVDVRDAPDRPGREFVFVARAG